MAVTTTKRAPPPLRIEIRCSCGGSLQVDWRESFWDQKMVELATAWVKAHGNCAGRTGKTEAA